MSGVLGNVFSLRTHMTVGWVQPDALDTDQQVERLDVCRCRNIGKFEAGVCGSAYHLDSRHGCDRSRLGGYRSAQVVLLVFPHNTNPPSALYSRSIKQRIFLLIPKRFPDCCVMLGEHRATFSRAPP